MTPSRAILHVDMDAFFVSVELRRRPELRGKPVVVGGSGPRGVVAAASYEARRYGVFSAMPGSMARRRCPAAVFLDGDHRLYSEVSDQVHEIFASFTPLVEPLALDEAFLDVSGSLALFGTARQIAEAIRERVRRELDLACSVGIAANKFLAKLGSKAAKPVADANGVRPGQGVVEIRAGEELAFLHPKPVSALWGVGPATLQRLDGLAIRTVGDLARIDPLTLAATLGKAAAGHLHNLANGIDDRPVDTDRQAKSVGHEETYATDICDPQRARTEVVRLADGVSTRLRRSGLMARTVTLKLRYASFETVTRSTTLKNAVSTSAALVAVVHPLLGELDVTRGVRLLGVHCSNFAEIAEQLSFDALHDSPTAVDEQWSQAADAVDAIRSRFGDTSIGPASILRPEGLRIVRNGQQQWGPNDSK